MRFSTTFKFAQRKSLIEKVKELVNPTVDSLDMNVEMSYEISVDEFAELYREYRSEVDASNSDVSSFIDQMKKIWTALKNFIHDLLGEIIGAEDKVYDVQNCIHRLRKNAADNKTDYRIYAAKLAKEEEKTVEEINKEKTED